MAILKINGDTSGSVSLTVPAVAGTNTATVPAQTGTLEMLGSGTAVTASGTSIEFTNIPSWVKRITVMFNGVSTSGTSTPLIQIGSGSVTTSGYTGASSVLAAGVTSTNYTTGIASGFGAAASIIQGGVILSLVGSNTWTAFGVLSRSDTAATATTGGNVTLSGALDRIRITTVNGTDTFDAGTINILYEG
jgi:hypothetical protein